jgi:hypothetical protein
MAVNGKRVYKRAARLLDGLEALLMDGLEDNDDNGFRRLLVGAFADSLASVWSAFMGAVIGVMLSTVLSRFSLHTAVALPALGLVFLLLFLFWWWGLQVIGLRDMVRAAVVGEGESRHRERYERLLSGQESLLGLTRMLQEQSNETSRHLRRLEARTLAGRDVQGRRAVGRLKKRSSGR